MSDRDRSVVSGAARLWAPWRSVYDRDRTPRSRCVFCELSGCDGDDARNLVLGRARHTFVVLNKHPYNNGHLMVVPFRHTAGFETLTREERDEVSAWLGRCIEVLGQELGAEGFNVGINQGEVAGSGIADHLHAHVLPRWRGDTNYLSTLAEVRLVPAPLTETFDRLSCYFSPGGSGNDRHPHRASKSGPG